MPILWQPETAPRPVVRISAQEMRILKHMGNVAQKYGFRLICDRCQQGFQGANHVQDAEYAIACGCRELRSPNPDRPLN